MHVGETPVLTTAVCGKIADEIYTEKQVTVGKEIVRTKSALAAGNPRSMGSQRRDGRLLPLIREVTGGRKSYVTNAAGESDLRRFLGAAHY